MRVLVDTSAMMAVIKADDNDHDAAGATWQALLAAEVPLVTTSYVVVETIALAQNRLGLDAVRLLRRSIFPEVAVHWVTPEEHERGLGMVLAVGRRRLSLVDAVSFTIMRQLGIGSYFGFDPHFDEQGFTAWAE